MSDAQAASRRPLASRNLSLFKTLATHLARRGISPNAISFSSIVFAIGAACFFAATSHFDGWISRLCWLGAACCIQLRLIANMVDGMVAIEAEKGGPTGELWNEAPDRVADAAILIGAGFADGGDVLLGFAAALFAMFVAYVRALGASVGAGQIFIGPQAKPHRMFVLTISSVALVFFPRVALVKWTLWIVIVGCAITAWRRLARIASFLRIKDAR